MITIHPDEKIVLEIRRHWFVLLAESFVLGILALLPILVLFFPVIGARIWSSATLASVSLFGLGAWYLVLWVAFFVVWTDYYLDAWIVTDKRVIDIEQHKLFHREVSEFRLDRIQDIAIDVRGILATLLHFGDIQVETAGETEKFIIRMVPHPDKVKDAIFKQQELAVQSANEKTP